MSEETLAIAVEAREKAIAATQRLNGINGSIDRMNNKMDKFDEKLNLIMQKLSIGEGNAQTVARFDDSKRFIWTMVVTLLSSGVVTSIITLAVR